MRKFGMILSLSLMTLAIDLAAQAQPFTKWQQGCVYSNKVTDRKKEGGVLDSGPPDFNRPFVGINYRTDHGWNDLLLNAGKLGYELVSIIAEQGVIVAVCLKKPIP